MLTYIWKSKQHILKSKLRLYNSNVLNVLLYGSECRKLTAKLAHKPVTLPKHVSTEDLMGILDQHHHQRRAAHQNRRNIPGHTDQEAKMEMAWTPNVTWRTAQDSLTLDSGW